jgi:hypothetical protein
MVTNKFGQELQPGDFILYAFIGGDIKFALLDKFSANKSRGYVSMFSLQDTEYKQVDGRWCYMPLPTPVVRREKTHINYPTSAFRVPIGACGLDPRLEQAYLEAQGKIIDGTA